MDPILRAVALAKARGAQAQALLKKTDAAHRAAVVTWAKWGVANEPRVHYGQIRPMPLKPSLPITTDCSGFATLCYKLAGCPDPNGLNYNGQGYTGTLLQYGKHIAPEECLPGDLIVYGKDPGHHVVIAVTKGPDPMCVSHGQEKGPALIQHSVEAKYQPPGVVFLRFPMTEAA